MTLSHVHSTFIHILLHLKGYISSQILYHLIGKVHYPKKKKRQERRIDAYMLSIFSCVRLFVTPWTVAHQAPLSMRFSRQECWSGLPCPSSGIQPASLLSPALAGRLFTTSVTWEAPREEYTKANEV